ncbi:NfeD family protein [Calditerrivibrio nitroreducens]|uniref:Nodulation efficiency protein NfeD n=1 Tax=Calditerrivibrio nitroreducens (strain DSM 19672 / NBRC 101217 / Yu37-1) TaxID=768670 RepID=E4TFP0_CALNY|nr:nodulation protein NfeD [Calditerrivibrio nitroreducens]ADR18508.1 Nodulation efficiency protein NfeD [Calditerrivibrio nitroreducens DSM 19672]
MRRFILIALFLIFSLPVFSKEIYTIEVNGIITEFTYKFIKVNIENASRADSVFLVKLDTPGGILESTRKIVQLFLESKIPVVVYVSPQGARATSAGAFIALSSNYLLMSDGTHIGAAHPVNITGEDIKGDMRKKVENDTTAFIRSIAQKRGKNEQIATEMVINSISLTAREAYDKRIVDDIVNTEEELIEKIKNRFNIKETLFLKKYEPSITEKIAFFLSDPNIIVLLLLIAIASIFLEFKMPGTFIFASIGIAAIILFLLAINIIPINYLGLLLILAGIVLLIAEIFITSFGLLSIAGISALAAGLYILFSKGGNMGINVSLPIIIILILFFGGVILLIGKLVIKDFKKRSVTGTEGMIGKIGEVLDWDTSSRKGKILVHGEIWSAESDTDINRGDKVEVLQVNDLMLKVKRIDR